MNDKLNHLQLSLIQDYDYSQWFQEIPHNGKTLNDSERKEYATIVDETVAQFSESLPILNEILEDTKDRQDAYSKVDRTVVSVMLFVIITMIDSMVASKYFILADKDYDRRFMRGKLFVILNEGFKNLYGFDKKTYKDSEWDKLLPLLNHFTEKINLQYQELTARLEKHAHSSSWWKDERNAETHLDAEMLYKSRQEEIIESMVMMDMIKLYQTLLAVNIFLEKVHRCLLNLIISKHCRVEQKMNRYYSPIEIQKEKDGPR